MYNDRNIVKSEPIITIAINGHADCSIDKTVNVLPSQPCGNTTITTLCGLGAYSYIPHTDEYDFHTDNDLIDIARNEFELYGTKQGNYTPQTPTRKVLEKFVRTINKDYMEFAESLVNKSHNKFLFNDMSHLEQDENIIADEGEEEPEEPKEEPPVVEPKPELTQEELNKIFRETRHYKIVNQMKYNIPDYNKGNISAVAYEKNFWFGDVNLNNGIYLVNITLKQTMSNGDIIYVNIPSINNMGVTLNLLNVALYNMFINLLIGNSDLIYGNNNETMKEKLRNYLEPMPPYQNPNSVYSRISNTTDDVKLTTVCTVFRKLLNFPYMNIIDLTCNTCITRESNRAPPYNVLKKARDFADERIRFAKIRPNWGGKVTHKNNIYKKNYLKGRNFTCKTSKVRAKNRLLKR